MSRNGGKIRSCVSTSIISIRVRVVAVIGGRLLAAVPNEEEKEKGKMEVEKEKEKDKKMEK